MKKYLLSSIILILFTSSDIHSQKVKQGIELPQLTNQEELALLQAIENDTIFEEWISNTSNDATKNYRQSLLLK